MGDRLFDALEPTVRGLGYELLGIERGRAASGQLLRLYIDHADGIDVEDCAKVSRQVGDVLDADDLVRGEYTLEVSSPGIDRPLFTLAQHRPFIGEAVQIKLRNLVNERRRLSGVLVAVGEDSLEVDLDGENFVVPYLEVESSRLAGVWKA